MPNKSGARGIHIAASKGHVAVVNSLILKGESVDAATNVSNKQMKQKLCDLLMQVSLSSAIISMKYETENVSVRIVINSITAIHSFSISQSK